MRASEILLFSLGLMKVVGDQVKHIGMTDQVSQVVFGSVSLAPELDFGVVVHVVCFREGWLLWAWLLDGELDGRHCVR